jgi:integrase
LNTVKAKAVILHSLYEELRALRLITENPFDRLKREFRGVRSGDRRPNERLKTEDVQKILSLIDNTREGVRDLAMLALMFGCGLRRGEIRTLKLSDFKTSDSGVPYLRLRDTKSGHTQIAKGPDWCWTKIKLLIAQRLFDGANENSPVFVEYYRDETSKFPISSESLYRIFKKRLAQAGVIGCFSPHSARATAITLLLEKGFSHYEVKDFSRHSNISTVERYDKRRTSIEQSVGRKVSYD